MVPVSVAVSPVSLRIDRLTLFAGGQAAIRDFSAAVLTGTLTWITGENGAGKSTLLRFLAAANARDSRVTFDPHPAFTDVTYYRPSMQAPEHVVVNAWLEFNRQLSAETYESADLLLPDVAGTALLTRLSTGEAKRMLLWSLLRRRTRYTFLDEPYEHLSPAAKSNLTDTLRKRAHDSVVVVATNQEVPDIAAKQVIELQ
jgi:ABC-type cobalamin/Fe3+-siderophores transport system ATPase subunit